jgi:hypothetical protein
MYGMEDGTIGVRHLVLGPQRLADAPSYLDCTFRLFVPEGGGGVPRICRGVHIG